MARLPMDRLGGDPRDFGRSVAMDDVQTTQSTHPNFV